MDLTKNALVLTQVSLNHNMSATIRLELFPHDLIASISFYTRILNFVILRHEPGPASDASNLASTGYAHLRRSTIQLGLATKPTGDYPPAARDIHSRSQFRRWPVGVEILMEVDDVWAEKDRVLSSGWSLDSEMVRQAWGLWDFRIVDPDGYFWRISERGGEDGKGKE